MSNALVAYHKCRGLSTLLGQKVSCDKPLSPGRCYPSGGGCGIIALFWIRSGSAKEPFYAYSPFFFCPGAGADKGSGCSACRPGGGGLGRPLRQRQDHPAALAQQFPQSIILHTDDFYLPPARRVPDWQHIPCANMDLTRLAAQALAPAQAGQAVMYQAYSCREGAYRAPQQLSAQPLVILEGSYSHHPLLRPYETLRVWVSCSKAQQTSRLQAREGVRYADFAARWIPLEEGYFAQYQIPETADFVVDTTF